MTNLTVGQRVMTPLDEATIIGFESFLPNGSQGPDVFEDNGNRVHVRLDTPSKWILHSQKQPDPYMFRSLLGELKE
jgi:hypothetical protein